MPAGLNLFEKLHKNKRHITFYGWYKIIGNEKFLINGCTATCSLQYRSFERSTKAMFKKHLYIDTKIEVTSGTLVVHYGYDLNNTEKRNLYTIPKCGDENSDKNTIIIPSGMWYNAHILDRTHVGADVTLSGYILHPKDVVYEGLSEIDQPNYSDLYQLKVTYNTMIEPKKRKNNALDHPTVPEDIILNIRNKAVLMMSKG